MGNRLRRFTSVRFRDWSDWLYGKCSHRFRRDRSRPFFHDRLCGFFRDHLRRLRPGLQIAAGKMQF